MNRFGFPAGFDERDHKPIFAYEVMECLKVPGEIPDEIIFRTAAQIVRLENRNKELAQENIALRERLERG